MISEKELNEAIAECQGARNPNASTCIMLAAFLTIKREMYGSDESDYSFATEPKAEKYIDYYSDTEFGKMIDGKEAFEVWSVMDELMDAIQVLNPPLYKSVIRKIG